MGSSVECLLEGSDAVVLSKDDDDQMTQSTEQLSVELSDGDDVVERRLAGGGEEETDEEEVDEEAELTWRLDPAKSLSDWTVQVVVKGTRTQQTYHVHKNVLAIGPRRSNYFAEAFAKHASRAARVSRRQPKIASDQWDCMSTMSSFGGGSRCKMETVENVVIPCVSRIELHRFAADAFPVLLDYLYSKDGNLDITSDNATALHSLSYYLEIKSLRKIVKDFWTENISMDNLCTFYHHARIFKDRRIIAYAEEYCASHIFEVPENTVVDILTVVDPQFFLNVVTSPMIGAGKVISLRLSLLIAVYCNIHKREMDKNTFFRLTAMTHLPNLEIKAARALLEIEDEICGPESRNYVSSLKQRSISVLSDHWDVACLVIPDKTTVSTEPKKEVTFEDTDLTKGVNLPRLFGEPLEMFTSLSFLCAKRRIDALEADRKALALRNQELALELEELRKRLDEVNYHITPTTTKATDPAAKP